MTPQWPELETGEYVVRRLFPVTRRLRIGRVLMVVGAAIEIVAAVVLLASGPDEFLRRLLPAQLFFALGLLGVGLIIPRLHSEFVLTNRRLLRRRGETITSIRWSDVDHVVMTRSRMDRLRRTAMIHIFEGETMTDLPPIPDADVLLPLLRELAGTHGA